MLGSWKLGRIAGIDLYLHPTFLILLGVVGLTQGGISAVLLLVAVFGCVVLHELGHALTARAYGIGTQDITLSPIGGVARLERMPRSPGAELLITLAGPGVNLVIALVAWLLLPILGNEATVIGAYASALLAINLFMAGFNLIPAFPMDGGRILRALLSPKLGRLQATEIAAGLGQGLAIALPLGLLLVGIANPMHWILAAFLWFAAKSERMSVRMEEHERIRVAARRRAGFAASEPGVWFAPPGYRWVHRPPGVWQLVPVVVPIDDPRDAIRWY
jgi:Zn-dependent protease